MAFQKGHIPANKGKGYTVEHKIELIICSCGCGKEFNKYGWRNRVRKFIPYHNVKMLGDKKGRFKKGEIHLATYKEGYIPWSKTVKGKGIMVSWNKGTKGLMPSGKNNSMYGKTEHFKRIGVIGALKQSRNKQPTSIEKKIYEELKSRGLLFETQKLINGRFLVDAYIPSLNLIIEADGDYWHSLDRVKKKDRAENAYLTKCCYNLLRLSEKEINNETFKEKIENRNNYLNWQLK